MDLTVFVPTRGHTGVEHITLNEITRMSNVRPVVVCPENEVSYYSRNYDTMACPATNINETHAWILANCPTRGSVAMDDDMYFSYRPEPNTPRPLERVKDLNPMFEWISRQLDAGFAHGGISARQGNQNIPREYTDCIRVNNVHFFDTAIFRAEDIRLPASPVMHDFFFTLTMLMRGYPNRVGYHYCWSQRASGFKGGCSLYRTQELQTTWCNTLKALFPDYVKLVTKSNLTGGSVFAGDRIDVNIGWLKAWADHVPAEMAIDGVAYVPATPDTRRR